MHHQQLLLAGGAHHLDGGLVAVHKDLPARIEQENGIGAPLKQLSEHGFIISQRGMAGTGTFVPFNSGRR